MRGEIFFENFWKGGVCISLKTKKNVEEKDSYVTSYEVESWIW